MAELEPDGEALESMAEANEAPDSTPILYPPAKRLRSLVWEYFGYPKKADGSIQDDGEPTCKLCGKKVKARTANTSNLKAHLRDWHKPEHAQLKSKVSSSVSPS